MSFLCLYLLDTWYLQASNICYGARDDKYGEFNIMTNGIVVGLKLVSVSGGLECCINCNSGISKFGCSNQVYVKDIATIITMENRLEWVTPTSDTTMRKGFYSLPGYDVSSNEIIFKGLNLKVTRGMISKIWFSQDLLNISENNNSGNHCVDVYAMFG